MSQDFNVDRLDAVKLKITPITQFAFTLEEALPIEPELREHIITAFKEGFQRYFDKHGDFDYNGASINARFIKAVEICDVDGNVLGTVTNCNGAEL